MVVVVSNEGPAVPSNSNCITNLVIKPDELMVLHLSNRSFRPNHRVCKHADPLGFKIDDAANNAR